MNEPTQRPNATPGANGFEFNRPTIAGLLYLASCITGISAIIGVVLCYVFKQQAISRAAPVLFKMVVLHHHVAGVHHRYSSSVFPKAVVGISIVVGKHKMQAVTNVVLTKIALHVALGHKFQVDAIAVPFYRIVTERQMIAFPGMDGVAGVLFFGGFSLNGVVAGSAMVGVGEINPKITLADVVVEHLNIFGAEHFYRCPIRDTGTPGPLKTEAFHHNFIRADGDDLPLPTGIEQGFALPQEGQGFVDFDAVLVVRSGTHQNGIVRCGPVNGLLNRSTGRNLDGFCSQIGDQK